MEVLDGDRPPPPGSWTRLGPYADELEKLHGERVDEILRRNELIVDDTTRDKLLRACQRAAKQAKRVITRQMTEGDYSPDLRQAGSPNSKRRRATSSRS